MGEELIGQIIGVAIIVGLAVRALWPNKRKYMNGVKVSDMPPGMTYTRAIQWLRENYNGPSPKGMTSSMAHQILMKTGYKCHGNIRSTSTS